MTDLNPTALYWEPRNPGRIACAAHSGMSTAPHDRVTPAEIAQFAAEGIPADCEDCGMTDGGEHA